MTATSHGAISRGEGGDQRQFGADASEAAFPLGGIGTGTVSLGARGQLRDWEIFNEHGKDVSLPFSFFAIRTEASDSGADVRVLAARRRPPYTQMDGFVPGDVAGLPHFEASTMRGEYPYCWVDFMDSSLPVEVSLETFTPFIPLNADDSGIPAAIFRYRVRNRSHQRLDVSVVGSLANAVGFKDWEPYFGVKCDGLGRNEFRDDANVRGIFMASDLPDDHLRTGTMALVSRARDVSAKPAWAESRDAWVGPAEFWNEFKSQGRLDREPSTVTRGTSPYEFSSVRPVGSLALHQALEPGSEHVFEFFLCWHFPNRERRWNGFLFPDGDVPSQGLERNYYATRFADAWSVAGHLGEEVDRLDRTSRDFHRAFFSSTLPPSVLDAVASNISIIRSTTCFRIADGTLLAWEGSFGRRGSCEGSCTHVWNYAQTMAFLFPELERSMRRVEFLLETDDEGRMAFRSNRVFGRQGWDHTATDGQLGTIVRLYREWRLSGDDKFLEELWPSARRALDYAITRWDTDGDAVLDGEQHTGYDTELYGPNSLTAPLFIAALRAGAKMAAYFDEDAAYYEDLATRSAERADGLLWNGEYYVQRIDADSHPHQYGNGCLTDQLFGQFLARFVGLGDVLPRDRVRAATEAIFRNNFMTSLEQHECLSRVYALNDEAGVVVCSWPHDDRPRNPFYYGDEFFSGIEYWFAAQLIYEGEIDKGLTIVKAVRDRYDGYKRNPWNEAEAGGHYARTLSSWGVYAALCGSDIDMINRRVTFQPAVNAEDFAAFFVAGGAWGVYRQRVDPTSGSVAWDVDVLYGDLDGVAVNADRLPGLA